MDLFITAFIVMFVVVDPLGTAGVYTALTAKMERDAAKAAAVTACTIASCILIAFGFFGIWILNLLSVSIPAFRIAGGVLLFYTAFRMIMGYHDPDQIESESGTYKDRSSIAVFPLAIPLLAGPGCMTAVLLLMTEHPSALSKIVIVFTIIAVHLFALATMLMSRKIGDYLGSTGNSLLARIMGVLLAAMAVQFVIDAIKQLLSGTF